MSALTAGLCLLPVGVLIMVLSPRADQPAVLAIYLLFGTAQGALNPPITNTAVSGMPASMAGVAASVASVGRQTGTTLGVAIAGTILGSAPSRGGMAFTSAEHGVWWLVLGLGVGILVLGLLSTGRCPAPSARPPCSTVTRRAAHRAPIAGDPPGVTRRGRRIGWLRRPDR